MQKIKICFIYGGETNERFLEILKKMTPKRSGIWKDIQGVVSDNNIENLVLTTNSLHRKQHCVNQERSSLGRWCRRE
jgi:hypothetical protein